MCAGVVVILATLKFSTSPSRFGLIDSRIAKKDMISTRGVVSLIIKYGKNFILS